MAQRIKAAQERRTPRALRAEGLGVRRCIAALVPRSHPAERNKAVQKHRSPKFGDASPLSMAAQERRAPKRACF